MNTPEKSDDSTARNMMEHLAVPLAVLRFADNRAHPVVLTDGFCRLFGYGDRSLAYEAMEQDICGNIHPDDRARIFSSIYRIEVHGGSFDVTCRTNVPSMSPEFRLIRAKGESVTDGAGDKTVNIWYSDEGVYAGEKDLQKEKLFSAAGVSVHGNTAAEADVCDYLTGLPNMTRFFEQAEAGKSAVQSRGGKPVMLYMDFSGMKFFNLKHGFEDGDRLLRSFAEILSDIFGREHCCRINADHFVVQNEQEGLEDRLERTIHACRKMNRGKTLPLHIGVYIGQNENIHTSVACDRAKMACSSLRGRYETAVEYFSSRLSEEAELRQYVVENIDRAIKERWIRLYLQPIIRTVSECVCDVEALARWIDPVRGFLAPISFIPALEDSGLIYRLDLHMLDLILENISNLKNAGIYVVPHSINLSRSDFDACDMVEEIRSRVDAAGVSRSLITIEITESVIGGSMDFMKEQIERFQKLGFRVWMDDFGTGYSSLDILQCVKFDLLKFDRSFLLSLEAGNNGKVLLTEMMKVATSLGMDTICEGVETREQVEFLREIGCSKLQGFYYSKPLPFEEVRKLHDSGTLISHEIPEESSYYESLGRINLYDISAVTCCRDASFSNIFNAVPVAVLELNDRQIRCLRSNRSYQDFIRRFFNLDILKDPLFFRDDESPFAINFSSMIRRCCDRAGSLAVFDHKLPDGAEIHSFARMIGSNPVSGTKAVCLAVLSVTDPEEDATYADIARALSSNYYLIYVADLSTDNYVEYTYGVGCEEVNMKRSGSNFFESLRHDLEPRVYLDDLESFRKTFTRENVIRDLDCYGTFTATCRLVDTGSPVYVCMKITRMYGSSRIIAGISNIDAFMKQRQMENRLRVERKGLSRIASLSPDFLALYTINPETDHYVQFEPSGGYEQIDQSSDGDNFFTDGVLYASDSIIPEDLEILRQNLTKENILRIIKQSGFFSCRYRILQNSGTVTLNIRASLVEENDGSKIILGVMRNDEEYRLMLESAYRDASANAVINSHLARALAFGYTELFYVNIETDEFIEFKNEEKTGKLIEIRRASNFFESCGVEVKIYVHQDDQSHFMKVFNYQFLSHILEHKFTYEFTYRRVANGRAFHVLNRITRMDDDRRIIVITVSDIDDQVRHFAEQDRIAEERVVYARLHALSGNYLCVYVVDPETAFFREFSSAEIYHASFSQAREGNDFFTFMRDGLRRYAYPDDRNRILLLLTRENILKEIERNGLFSLGYRVMIEEKPRYVQLECAIVAEKDGRRLIVGLKDVDAQVRQENEYKRSLATAQSLANLDPLTGVRSRHAYLKEENIIDRRIAEHMQSPFAVVMFDVNELKQVNDRDGHRAGDQYLRDASGIIGDIFRGCPVYRLGGDEFAVILQGDDYSRIDEFMSAMQRHNEGDGIKIACGCAKFENDACVATVFDRADRNMYQNKRRMKAELEK